MTTEKEGMAVVLAIKKFNEFLYGRPYIPAGDPEPPKYTARTKFWNAGIMRRAHTLQGY